MSICYIILIIMVTLTKAWSNTLCAGRFDDGTNLESLAECYPPFINMDPLNDKWFRSFRHKFPSWHFRGRRP
jgi:hypothetical protein